MTIRLKFITFLCLLLGLCASCVSRDIHCGHELNPESIAKLKVKNTTKQEVLDILGSPSSSSTFDENIWYYINMTRTGVTPFKKGISTHKVLQLTFHNDILVAIKMISGEKGAYDFNKNKTYVHGDDISSFNDFVRNLGKYNQKKEFEKN